MTALPLVVDQEALPQVPAKGACPCATGNAANALPDGDGVAGAASGGE